MAMQTAGSGDVDNHKSRAAPMASEAMTSGRAEPMRSARSPQNTGTSAPMSARIAHMPPMVTGS